MYIALFSNKKGSSTHYKFKWHRWIFTINLMDWVEKVVQCSKCDGICRTEYRHFYLTSTIFYQTVSYRLVGLCTGRNNEIQELLHRSMRIELKRKPEGRRDEQGFLLDAETSLLLPMFLNHWLSTLFQIHHRVNTVKSLWNLPFPPLGFVRTVAELQNLAASPRYSKKVYRIHSRRVNLSSGTYVSNIQIKFKNCIVEDWNISGIISYI